MVTDDKEQPVESHRLFELGEYVRMKTNDLTQGSIGKGFVLFAIPLFLGSLTNTAWEQITPITVRISPPTAPARTAIHTDSFISFSFFAPKSCEITIPAPTATPVNRLI